MDTLTILAALLVTVLSAGRITRLFTQDTYPPAAFLRAWWDKVTNDGPWADLLHCHWCFGPYATAVVGGTGLLTGFHTAWWVFFGWLALSYLTSMIVERDEVA